MELEKNSILYLRLGTPYSSSASFYTLYTDFNLSWKKKKKESSFITIRSDIIYHEINCKKGKERRVKSFVAHWEEGNKEGDPFSRSIHGLRTVVSSASFPVCRGKKKHEASRGETWFHVGEGIKKKKRKKEDERFIQFSGTALSGWQDVRPGEGKKLAPDVYQRDGGGTVKQKPCL